MIALVVFGLIFGSFVNALVWRLHEKRDWVKERSECPHCHHQLAGKDLIPVVSYLLLKGKCRYCHHKIDDTPLIELAVPALWVASYVWWPQPLHGVGLFEFGFWLVFIVGLVALTLYDFRWFLLPDKIVFPLAGLAVVQVLGIWLLYHGSWRDAAGAALGAVLISGMFYVLFVASKGTWIGGGDVKLGVVLGLLAGGPLESMLLLFVASVGGTLFALPAVFTGKANRKAHVPFGPFLILGLIVVRLFGAGLINWYTGLLAI
jgi:prepilin signal peptidase PulO-like enzyme (type II secretory pathway)